MLPAARYPKCPKDKRRKKRKTFWTNITSHMLSRPKLKSKQPPQRTGIILNTERPKKKVINTS